MPYPRTRDHPEAVIKILLAVIERTPAGGATLEELKEAYREVKDREPSEKTIRQIPRQPGHGGVAGRGPRGALRGERRRRDDPLAYGLGRGRGGAGAGLAAGGHSRNPERNALNLPARDRRFLGGMEV